MHPTGGLGKLAALRQSQLGLPLELLSLVQPLLHESYPTFLPEWELSTNCHKWNCLAFPFLVSQGQSLPLLLKIDNFKAPVEEVVNPLSLIEMIY